MTGQDIYIIKPNLQISFYNRLKVLKSMYLQDALNIAINKVKL